MLCLSVHAAAFATHHQVQADHTNVTSHRSVAEPAHVLLHAMQPAHAHLVRHDQEWYVTTRTSQSLIDTNLLEASSAHVCCNNLG